MVLHTWRFCPYHRFQHHLWMHHTSTSRRYDAQQQSQLKSISPNSYKWMNWDGMGCCLLLTYCPRDAPDDIPDMPQMMYFISHRHALDVGPDMLQTYPRGCPRHTPDDAPDMPRMMPQTCPRWYPTPRHAPNFGLDMPQTCSRWCPKYAPDMPQMMPQMMPRTCPR